MSIRRTRQPEWLVEGGGCIGIGLGSSSWAEHEFGISELNFAFGLTETLDGLPRRTITTLPKGLNRIEFKARKDTRMKRPSVQRLAIFFSDPYVGSSFEYVSKDEL